MADVRDPSPTDIDARALVAAGYDVAADEYARWATEDVTDTAL